MVHLLIVGRLMLWPRAVPWVPEANVEPLATIGAALARGPWAAVCDLGAPLLMLAPLGVLLPLAAGRLNVSPVLSLLRTVGAGGLLALVLEALQASVPGRVPDVDALLLNILGVALAHLAVVPRARARLRRRAEDLRGPTPKITRVGPLPKADVLSASRTYL
ncbi:VanZ family protein [Streptomyces benahoarensis]|uniref:VanZ family protein n=1 Tax=Streptomyces benahoarensis TaxID=2595054 RepID=A0A553ZNY8_9ACTN|nr:VanZ family protein [Streptomyces benahoarensis]TSB43180.1 VanZ family protein [Streptomyces benahoarensis]